MTANTVTSNGSRSLHGCWTCRLRKKKCDELRPTCSTCTSLELYCHGFGPRPKWMDRGALQREKAFEVKRILRNNTSKKHLRRSLKSTQQMTSQSDAVLGEEAAPLDPLEPSSTPGNGFASNRDTSQKNLCDNELVGDSAIFNLQMWDELFHNDLLLDEQFDQDEITLNQSWLNGRAAIRDADSVSSSVGRSPPESISASMIVSPEVTDYSQWGDGFPKSNSQLEPNLESLATLSQKYSKVFTHDNIGSIYPTSIVPENSSNFCQESFALDSGIERHRSYLAGYSSSNIGGNMEDTLLMHYLDEVFYMQYPFYHSSRGERGWLFSILRRDKSAYYATLALSGYHRHSTLSRYTNNTSSLLLVQYANKNYYLALQEVQRSLGQSSTWSETTVLNRSIETLVSILQLLHWELFHGGTESWQIHLQAASTLVSTLVRRVDIAQNTQFAKHSGSKNKQQRERSLNREDDPATGFLLGSFISMDIISCASVRRDLFLDLDHKFLLENAGIHLEKLNGCKNWVMVLILEISQLDAWKKEAGKSQTLSIIDLAKRGGHIEERLWEELAKIEKENPIATVKDTSTEITRIFALSAMTYLHAVISGSHPELPEIKRSVSKTVTAFQRLTDMKLLRNLVWPLCISGSLALEDEYASFRFLITSAKVVKSDLGTCFEAFKLIEECWEMRKTGSNNCDWVSVMKKCSRYVLLA